MRDRVSNKTKATQIANYWRAYAEICETELNFDWADAETHCWNCGIERKRGLERCHIIPHALGGLDKPDNYVLMCKDCHSEAPNTNCKDDMWDWIKSNRIDYSLYGVYKIYRALEMFKEKQGFDFSDTYSNRSNVLQEVLFEFENNVGTHGSKITISTYYYLLKKLSDKYKTEDL